MTDTKILPCSLHLINILFLQKNVKHGIKKAIVHHFLGRKTRQLQKTYTDEVSVNTGKLLLPVVC